MFFIISKLTYLHKILLSQPSDWLFYASIVFRKSVKLPWTKKETTTLNLVIFKIGYGDIESDEDLMLEDFDFDDVNLQSDFDTEETWASVSLTFNPYQASFTPLEVARIRFSKQKRRMYDHLNIYDVAFLQQ